MLVFGSVPPASFLAISEVSNRQWSWFPRHQTSQMSIEASLHAKKMTKNDAMN